MYGGDVVESAPVNEFFARPTHPYSEALLAAMPRVDRSADALAPIPGQVPTLPDLPAGCRFQSRCPLRIAKLRRAAAVDPARRRAGARRALLGARAMTRAPADERALARGARPHQDLQGTARLADSDDGRGARARRRLVRRRPRRGARHRRRIGLRQVDRRARLPAPDHARRRQRPLRRHRRRARRAPARCACCADACRSSSRIRLRRSIRASASPTRSASRSGSTASPAAMT